MPKRTVRTAAAGSHNSCQPRASRTVVRSLRRQDAGREPQAVRYVLRRRTRSLRPNRPAGDVMDRGSVQKVWVYAVKSGGEWYVGTSNAPLRLFENHRNDPSSSAHRLYGRTGVQERIVSEHPNRGRRVRPAGESARTRGGTQQASPDLSRTMPMPGGDAGTRTPPHLPGLTPDALPIEPHLLD